MTLPAGEQRVLDRIENSLRATEPRLASMYAIFTRLTSNESWPRREQLPDRRGWRGGAAWIGRVLSPRLIAVAIIPRGSKRLARALVLAQMVAVVAVLGLLIGLASHTVRTACHGVARVPSTLTKAHALDCQPQLGYPANQIPAK
jgi:hypothetical protein